MFRLVRSWLFSIGAALAITGHAESIIFHLRNGDRITGSISSENADTVTVETLFAGKITLPVGQIERRERPPSTRAAPVPGPVPPSSSSVTPPTAAKTTEAPKSAVAESQGPSKVASATPPPPSSFKKFLSQWQGDAQIGVNLGFSTRDHQTYTGRLKALYAPTKTLRNSFDYLASYGTTDGILSENQMDGSWKLEYDIGKQKRFLVYNALGAGYNEIQKIDFRYDLGPGMGYKWIVRTNYVLKTEFGGNYQQQYFSTGEEKTRYSLRLAEDMTWQATSRLKFDNKLEFFPEVDDPANYRLRAEGNLSYLLRNNLTLSLSVIDLYDTTPAQGVSNNDLQIRSLIGIKF